MMGGAQGIAERLLALEQAVAELQAELAALKGAGEPTPSGKTAPSRKGDSSRKPDPSGKA